ncbi:restriction endonuclease subunit S [Enterococcus eurekensis]|uniref:Restriction endonuclease subunit S n=1 Tax=Enterococcus eurekensis TaxID=1159753 RepID=A0ABV9M327_9ENTE
MISNYEKAPLRELVKFVGKGIPPKYAQNKTEDTIVVLNQKTNRNFKIDYKLSRLNDLLKKKVPVDKMIISNDVLINSTGVGTAGRIAQIFSVPEATTVDGHMIIVRADSNKINPIYLGYALKAQQKVIESLQEGSTGQTELNRQRLLDEIEISFPDESVKQDEIARLFLSLDNLIAENEKINHHLEQIATSIFNDRFINLKQFNGKIPSNWKKGVLGDFVQIKRGGSPRPIQNFLSKEGYRWLKISDVSSLDSPFIYNIRERIREEGLKKTILLKPGSLVLSNSATPGIPKILSVESCIHDGWLYFPESELPNEFLYLFFQAIRPNLIQLGNGSVFTNLKTDILKKYEFYMPEKNVIEEFNKVIGPIFSTIQSITEENLKLIEIKDYLLPKLMSGKISATS